MCVESFIVEIIYKYCTRTIRVRALAYWYIVAGDEYEYRTVLYELHTAHTGGREAYEYSYRTWSTGALVCVPILWYSELTCNVLRVPTQGEETRYKKVPYLSKASFRRINTGYHPKLRKWLPVGQKSLPLPVS